MRYPPIVRRQDVQRSPGYGTTGVKATPRQVQTIYRGTKVITPLINSPTEETMVEKSENKEKDKGSTGGSFTDRYILYGIIAALLALLLFWDRDVKFESPTTDRGEEIEEFREKTREDYRRELASQRWPIVKIETDRNPRLPGARWNKIDDILLAKNIIVKVGDELEKEIRKNPQKARKIFQSLSPESPTWLDGISPLDALGINNPGTVAQHKKATELGLQKRSELTLVAWLFMKGRTNLVEFEDLKLNIYQSTLFDVGINTIHLSDYDDINSTWEKRKG